MKLLIGYIFILLSLSIYSFVLVDPNFTLFNHVIWEYFRNEVVQIGYHNRYLSWNIFLIILSLMTVFHLLFIKKPHNHNPLLIASIVGIIMLFSYPLLSHDFFNYIFDAKIATVYYDNPYEETALEYPNDNWTRFMHWTHRTYPYGPVFLGITLVPSFLGFNIFLFHYFLFKALFVGSYMLAVFLLSKLKKEYALIFATHPLIIIEGLVNAHNDLIAVSLGILGVYLLIKKNNLWARFILLLSGGIKYITLPLIFLTKKESIFTRISLALVLGLITYLSYKNIIQPWYFLSVFVFLPYYAKYINMFMIFFTGLLLSYYPYIQYDAWKTEGNIETKIMIITSGFVINIIVMFLFFGAKKGITTQPLPKK